MKKFVFISHVTPCAKRSELRQDLYDISLKSLEAQTYSGWKLLQISEEESDNGKIKKVNLPAQGDRTRHLVSIFERKDVTDFIEDSDFIVKIDDDDIISPYVLEKAAGKEFDVYCDRFHTFFDISSGWISQQERPWIASTCIHKTEHALSKNDPKGSANLYLNSLFYCNHAEAWHRYYSSKKTVYATANHPVYLRVLSPTSITAGAKKSPLSSVSDIDFRQYNSYLKSFGYWKKTSVKDFDPYLPALNTSWKNFTGLLQAPIKNIGIADKISDRIVNYGKALRKLF